MFFLQQKKVIRHAIMSIVLQQVDVCDIVKCINTNINALK